MIKVWPVFDEINTNLASMSIGLTLKKLRASEEGFSVIDQFPRIQNTIGFHPNHHSQ